MLEILKTLKDTPLPIVLVIGGLIFLLIPFIQKINTKEVGVETTNQFLAGFIGFMLLVIGIGLDIIPSGTAASTPPIAIPSYVTSPNVEAPTVAQAPSLSGPSVATQQPILPAVSTNLIPQTASDAANLFGGPPASEWRMCPQETHCWTFSLPNRSFKISVPEYCLDANGSIDGWRYHGGYPNQPDAIEGTTRIWNTLEGATIRCW
jgi:hypothetical protein